MCAVLGTMHRLPMTTRTVVLVLLKSVLVAFALCGVAAVVTVLRARHACMAMDQSAYVRDIQSLVPSYTAHPRLEGIHFIDGNFRAWCTSDSMGPYYSRWPTLLSFDGTRYTSIQDRRELAAWHRRNRDQ
jgi:hypothetical protein